MPETATLPYIAHRPVVRMVNIENQIFTQIKTGDVKAYERVFKQYYEPLCQYAHTFLKDLAEAEEVVQQVFITIWNKKESIVIESSLKSYLYRSVTNACLNRIKQQKTRQKHLDVIQQQSDHLTNTTSDMVYAVELENKIMRCVNELPDQCKLVFELSRFEGLRFQEIADTLNISIKTVENHICKALKILREKLKDYLPFLLLVMLKIF